MLVDEVKAVVGGEEHVLKEDGGLKKREREGGVNRQCDDE